MKKILLVVEGDGEVQAGAILVRRVLHELHGLFEWDVETQRRRDYSHLRANNWANFRRYLSSAFHEKAPILWMLDCDDNCAVEVVKELSQEATNIGVRTPLAFALWVREYETMFLHDLDSVRERFRLSKIEQLPRDPESKRGAKEWLNSQMPRGQIYKERIDQSSLSAVVDLQRLQANYKSFQHFERALLWLADRTEPGIYPTSS